MRQKLKDVDFTGQKFGRLTALSKVDGTVKTTWRCMCDCGCVRAAPVHALLAGHIKSCGCITKERAIALCEANKTHGMTNTTEFAIWRGMLARCNNPKNKDWSRYGGRGVSVCNRWHTFENFFSDMGYRPAGLSIDRIDTNGNYEPDNCRWVDMKTQNRNRRSQKLLTHNNKTQCVSAWAEELGITRGTLQSRLSRGLSDSDVLTLPIRRY
jgi:hypothetical protein